MKLRKCANCNAYTFKQTCTKCNKETINPHPPKYSPEDVYGEFRRRMKAESNVDRDN
ncbi:MAG: RNA-protein complex protein Nop10 [Candidatus Aenigmarchaeota archaeon]|nr:RNA-protein complex protein Nop10 [Candidatus Aenigmarchaeota archaeon]